MMATMEYVHLQLRFEVLHDIQKRVVHLRLLRRLGLDSVQIVQSVTDVEWPVTITPGLVRRARGQRMRSWSVLPPFQMCICGVRVHGSE